jgi:flagellin-like hook-associated protein FlgL
MSTNRVTLETFYRQTMFSVLRRKEDLLRLNEQMSSGSRINRPSDDSIGVIASHLSERTLEEVLKYDSNIDHARGWLQQAETTMRNMSDLISMAKERAEQMSTGTYTPEQRQMIATDVNNFLEQFISLANTQVNGDYIFSGSRVDQPAASSDLRAENPAVPSAANAGPGEMWGQGSFTGLLSRKVTLSVVSFGSGNPSGTPGVAGETMTMSYSYVDDFDRTVTGTATLTGTGTGNGIDIGDGVQIYARDAQLWDPVSGLPVGSYNTGDTFTLTVGRHRGNNEDLDVNLSWANRMRYNYTLDGLFQQEGLTGGYRKNLLDLLTNWADSLLKDPTEQAYFETLPNGLNATNPALVNNPNTPSSSAQVLVDGKWQDLVMPDPSDPTKTVPKYEEQKEYWNDLKVWDLDFNVGAPVSLSSATLNDATLSARDFNFYLDTSNDQYNGIPSAANPMVLRIAYDDGTAPPLVDGGTVTITGTGAEAIATFNDPVTGDPIQAYVANMNFVSEDIVPAPTNPPPNIDAWDGVGVPPAGTSYAPTFYPENTDPDGYVGPPALTMTVTYNTSPGVREFQVLNIPGTGDRNPVDLDIDGDGNRDTSFYLSAGGTVDDGDYHRLSLQQYNTGQDESQALLDQALDKLETAQANLLKYSADAGARLNRLDVRENLLGSDNLRLNERLSQTKDIDVAKVATELKTYEILYQATLQSTAFISNRSLADYL